MRKNSTKFHTIPLLFSLLFFSFSCAVYFFLYKNVQDNNRAFEEAEVEWRAKNSKNEDMKSLERFLNSIEQERTLLDAHFVRSSDVVPFLDTIEGLAPQAGVSAAVSSVNVTSDGESLIVGVQATGAFENLYKFLTLLENSPYQLEFISAKMKKTGAGLQSETPESGSWTASFNIRLLSFIK